MSKCDGWVLYEHPTSEKVVEVQFDGCSHCGGGGCGDSGEVLSLCPKCLADLEIDPGAAGSWKRVGVDVVTG